MKNDQVLLEALAEALEVLKRKVRQLESQICESDIGEKHSQQINNLAQVNQHLLGRIRKLESKKEDQIIVDKSEKLKTFNINDYRKVVISLFIIGFLWYLIVLANRGIKYEDSYYKYQSMELFGLNKQEVDYLFKINQDSMTRLVDDFDSSELQ